MGLPKTLSALGPVMQLAWVPEDFDAALKHWTEVMGVGPFFLIENIHLEGMKYRGEPTEARFTLALAYWGDMQIELIRPEDSHPSIYRGEYGATGNGLHHVCLFVDDIADAYAACEAQGAEIVIEGSFGTSKALYADPGGGPGTLVEVLQRATDGPDLFAIIRAASENWDGSEPVRRFG